MTRYLLDRDVMSQLDQQERDRHENVRAWFTSVPDNSLYVSAITVMEAWKGLTLARRRASDNPARLRQCGLYENAFAELMKSLAGRIVPIDEPVAKLWGTLLGQQDKNRSDVCVAATARIHEMVIATRNTEDFVRRGVPIVDPFRKRRHELG